MAQVTLRGNPIATSGELPAVGSKAPDFTLTTAGLDTVSLGDLSGERVVLNISPSIDTSVCATAVRTFNERATDLEDTTVLTVTADLPFAHARFCGAEGLKHVTGASAFRSDFTDTYGVRMLDGPLAQLAARSVVVIDRDGTVLHSQLVPEIGEEPDYDAALAVL
jgi:thiol peroxidase